MSTRLLKLENVSLVFLLLIMSGIFISSVAKAVIVTFSGDVEINGSLNVLKNISAVNITAYGFFTGDGSLLTGISNRAVNNLERQNFTSGLNNVLVSSNQSWNFTSTGTTNITNFSVTGNITLPIKNCNKWITDSNGIGSCGIDADSAANAITGLSSGNFSNNLTERINGTDFFSRNLNVTYELKYLNDTKATLPVVIDYINLTGKASIDYVNLTGTASIGYINLTGRAFLGYLNLTGSIQPLSPENLTLAFSSQIARRNETNNFTITDGINQTYINSLILTHRVVNGSNGTSGIGVGLLFQSVDSVNETEQTGLIVSNFSDATNGTEDSELLFFTRENAGSLTQRLKISNQGNLNLTDNVILYNITARFAFINLSQSTFPASSCSGTDKATSLGINGQLTCSADVNGFAIGSLAPSNFSSVYNTQDALMNKTNNYTQGQIWSAPSNITANITYRIPEGDGQFCARFRGTTYNFTKCFNGTTVEERMGVFILPV